MRNKTQYCQDVICPLCTCRSNELSIKIPARQNRCYYQQNDCKNYNRKESAQDSKHKIEEILLSIFIVLIENVRGQILPALRTTRQCVSGGRIEK